MRFRCLQSCCGKRTLPLLVEFIDIQDYMLLLECTPWNRKGMAQENGWKCEHVGKKYLVSKIIFEYIFIQISDHKLHIHLGDNWTDPDINLDSATCFLCELLSLFDPYLSVKQKHCIFLENVNYLLLKLFWCEEANYPISIHKFNPIPMKIPMEFLEFDEIFSTSSRISG